MCIFGPLLCFSGLLSASGISTSVLWGWRGFCFAALCTGPWNFLEGECHGRLHPPDPSEWSSDLKQRDKATDVDPWRSRSSWNSFLLSDLEQLCLSLLLSACLPFKRFRLIFCYLSFIVGQKNATFIVSLDLCYFCYVYRCVLIIFMTTFVMFTKWGKLFFFFCHFHLLFFVCNCCF